MPVFGWKEKGFDQKDSSWAEKENKKNKSLFDESNMVDLEPPIRVHGKKREIPEAPTVPANSTLANAQRRFYR